MTAVQPRTPQQAAMLDPMGLTPFPTTRRRKGLFGSSVSSRQPLQIGIGGLGYGADDGSQPTDLTAVPPPIDAAPPPPMNWRKTVGADLMGQLPQTPPTYSLPPLDGQEDTVSMQPAPAMRGGFFGNAAQPQQTPLGMPGAPPLSDKTGARGMIIPDRQKARDKPGFDFRMLAGIIGDGLLGAAGQPGVYGPNMWRLRQQQAEHQDRMEQMREQTRLKLSEPDYATVNNRRVKIDPTTGDTKVLYTAPQDFEDYAATLGAEPGTPEFDRMVQDYVLRGSGPTATDNYNVREDYRQENREDLEGIRQGNRIGLQTHRQEGQRALKTTPTYRQANPLPPRSGGRSGGSSGGVREGQTATGPGGAKVVYRGGKWVPVK